MQLINHELGQEFCVKLAAQNSYIFFENRHYLEAKGHTPCLKGFICRK